MAPRASKLPTAKPTGAGALLVKMVPISDLHGYANNPRTHTPDQVALIAKSIREFGWTNPLIVDAGNELICGHGRLAAATLMGLTEAPAIQLGHLTLAQKRALVIADNRIAETGSQWDQNLLRLELEELKLSDFDLSLTGWSETELDQIFAPALDPAGEWQGMPEFEQQDKTAFRSIVVHMKDQEAVDAFAKLIGQRVSEKTRFVWYPLIERETYMDKRYESAA